MINRTELQRYLRIFLRCDEYSDYAPNGLQIEGKSEIKRICTAVTASASVINEAIMLQADALLVHHGYFWKGEAPEITGIKRNRIGLLLRHDINLFAYHLPLDCHPEVGNNACLANLLDLRKIVKYPIGKTNDLLWIGELATPCFAADFNVMLAALLQREPLLISASNHPINRLALCTGAAEDFITEAQQLGADAYLSGEISERTYYQATELGIHYFAAGHHATERYGIQALGEHLAEKFGVNHVFIDSENPI